MSVDTVRVSIPLTLEDAVYFGSIADPVRFFKVDTSVGRVLWTKTKGLAEVNLPSHSRGIHWELRDAKPGEIYRMMELTYGIQRMAGPEWEMVRTHIVRTGEDEDGFHYTKQGVVDDFRMLDLELSLPKLIRGHNVELLHNPVLAIEFLRLQLEDAFDVILPDTKFWFISRLDVCHAFRFPTQEIAQIVLDSLKNKRFPHKKAQIYEHSVFYPGREYAFKVYLKQPEYKAHSLRNDYKLVGERADLWYKLSAGVLRIEISLRNSALSKISGKKYHILSDVFYVDENGDFCYNRLLRDAFTRYFGEGDMMSEEDMVADRFKAVFGKRKANEMFRTWCMVQLMGEAKARRFMGENTWYTYKRDLRSAGVQNTPMIAELRNFRFQIPHPVFTVNHDDSDLVGLYQAYGILPYDDDDEDDKKRA